MILKSQRYVNFLEYSNLFLDEMIRVGKDVVKGTVFVDVYVFVFGIFISITFIMIINIVGVSKTYLAYTICTIYLLKFGV